MLPISKIFLLLCLGCLIAAPIFGETDPADSTQSDTTKIESTAIDSLPKIEEKSPFKLSQKYEFGRDTLLIEAYQTENSVEKKGQSPTVALFKSIAFPGWGQFSNRRYIKAAVVLTVESYFIYQAIDDATKASDWREKWLAEEDATLRSEYFYKYAKYRDDRNTNLWYTGAVIFISMFDAFVDAHLRGFPEKIDKVDDLSLDIKPGEQSKILLTYRF